MLRTRGLVLGLAFAIVVAACGPTPTATPTPAPSPIRVWILSPQQSEVIPLNTSHTIAFKAASFPEVAGFEFEYCSAPGVVLSLDLENIGEGGAEGTFYFADFPIAGSEAGPCTVKGRAVPKDPQYPPSPWAEVNFFYGQAPALVTSSVPTLLPSPTPTLVIIPGVILSPTPTKVGSWKATAKMNANCRAGPSTAHNEWGYALKDDIVEVVGRNEDGTWLNVLNPHGSGKCWLSIFALDVPFDVNGLPAVSYPTPPPSDAGQPPAAQGCTVTNPLNNQVTCVAPCPAGASPGAACTP